MYRAQLEDHSLEVELGYAMSALSLKAFLNFIFEVTAIDIWSGREAPEMEVEKSSYLFPINYGVSAQACIDNGRVYYITLHIVHGFKTFVH